MKEMLRLLSMFAALQLAQGQKIRFLDSFLGCWRDAQNRDFQKNYGIGHNVDTCRRKTARDKYKFFALQGGRLGQCFGGNKYGKYEPMGADSYCADKFSKVFKIKDLAAERMLLHGDRWANAVYYTAEQWFTPQKENAMEAKGHFVGCYWDDRNREYKNKFRNAKGKRVRYTYVDSVEDCAKLAEKNRMPYFAIQQGKECRMSKKMFNTYYNYPPIRGNKGCRKKQLKKLSKGWPNYGGADWTNAIYYTKKSLYYPGAFWESPDGDNTIRLAWANAYCLNIDQSQPRQKQKSGLEKCLEALEAGLIPESCKDLLLPLLKKAACVVLKGSADDCKWDSILSASLNQIAEAKFKAGQALMAYRCVDNQGRVADNMKFIVQNGLIKSKKDPTLCISYKGAKMAGSKQITMETCGAEGTFQKIQLYDDMTIRFTDAKEFGFHIFLGIGGKNGVNTRKLKTYRVTASSNEAFLIRSPAKLMTAAMIENLAPLTPKPTPVPTPSPPMKGLKKAMGWTITKGTCTIDITTGTPCAVSPNFPKPYWDDESCKVKMTKTKAVKPETFETENYFDKVKIGDVTLNGKLAKTPTINLKKGVGMIEWTSDVYLTAKGWKICKTK